jgi:hypothetical protein
MLIPNKLNILKKLAIYFIIIYIRIPLQPLLFAPEIEEIGTIKLGNSL